MIDCLFLRVELRKSLKPYSDEQRKATDEALERIFNERLNNNSDKKV